MRWAFWRSGRRSVPAEQRPLPEDVGLPAASSPRAGAAIRDEADQPYARSPGSPFSGASPDAAQDHVRREPTAALPDPTRLDPATAQDAAAVVAAAVRGLLAGDAPATDRALSPLEDRPTAARGASSLAAYALASRLPSLSGVSGEVVFDEPADELLHAYAGLLSERAEPLRRTIAPRLRDEVAAVAHLAADIAAQESEDDPDAPSSAGPPPLVLPDVAPRQQLLAACVLLAQTCRDGGSDVAALTAELSALARGTASG